VHPALADAARSAGLTVQLLPLMVLHRESTAVIPLEYSVRILPADDPALPSALVAIGLSYGTPGTAVGPVGAAARDAATAPDQHHESVRADIREGLTVVAVAADESGPIGGGSHSPRDEVTEITGVGTLPAHRRRGLGAAVTHVLAADAAEHGVELCFLTAGSTEIARVYAGVGFVRIGTSCIAEPENGE
jgi:GNAT superfamily N-acetyltransferase